jgi:hypothetical protein
MADWKAVLMAHHWELPRDRQLVDLKAARWEKTREHHWALHLVVHLADHLDLDLADCWALHWDAPRVHLMVHH